MDHSRSHEGPSALYEWCKSLRDLSCDEIEHLMEVVGVTIEICDKVIVDAEVIKPVIPNVAEDIISSVQRERREAVGKHRYLESLRNLRIKHDSR